MGVHGGVEEYPVVRMRRNRSCALQWLTLMSLGSTFVALPELIRIGIPESKALVACQSFNAPCSRRRLDCNPAFCSLELSALSKDKHGFRFDAHAVHC